MLASGNQVLLDVIYQDAKMCVLSGRYLTDLDTAVRLAALQMVLEWGNYAPGIHTMDFIALVFIASGW